MNVINAINKVQVKNTKWSFHMISLIEENKKTSNLTWLYMKT